MYGASLSFPQLKEYLATLTDAGLLDYLEEEKKYYTTKKGLYFLRIYKDVGSMLTARKNVSLHA